jgi:hypothetical protein
MKKDSMALPTLADVERDVLAECRKWGARLEQRLHQTR